MLARDDLDSIFSAMADVRSGSPAGVPEWRCRGRLVARLIDPSHLVIRAEFAYRDDLVRRHPRTFSVPQRYERHMMVVADLEGGDELAIEDALQAAWQMQRDPG